MHTYTHAHVCIHIHVYTHVHMNIYTCIYICVHGYIGLSGGAVVKHPPANAGDAGSNSGLGRSPGGENGKHSSILALKIPWTEEPGGLQSMGLQRVSHD